MEKQKLTKRQLKALETKNRIYKIAMDLMEKHGYENVKIEEICEKANVSVGSFYNYFKSKNDILNEVFKKADIYFEKYVMHNIKADNSLDKIVEYFGFYGGYMEYTGVDTMKQVYSFNNTLFIKEDRYMKVLLQEIISEGQSKGEITNNTTAKEMSEYLFIAARGITYDWCLHYGEYNIEEFMKNYFKRFVNIFKDVTMNYI